MDGISCGFSGHNEHDIRLAKEICQRMEVPHKTHWITASNFLDEFVPMLWQMD